jgi:hypothetical protein
MPEVPPVTSPKRLLKSPSRLESEVSCIAGTWTSGSGAATGVNAIKLPVPRIAIPAAA